MARRLTRKTTKSKGVFLCSPGTYRVRGRVTDPRTGRRKEIDKLVQASSVSEAAAIRRELIRHASAVPSTDSRPRVSTYISSWLRSKLPSIKRSTRKTYTANLQHAVDVLGEFFVDALRRDDLTAYRDEQVGTAAVPTINGRLRVLITVLHDAVVELRLPVDPTLGVGYLREPRRVEDDEAAGLTVQELRVVLEFLRTKYPQWFPLVVTLALTGMRFGEATALRWDDVDFATGSIRVRRAQWNGSIDTTKTGTTKIVAMAPLLADVLAGVRDRQRAQGPPGHDSGFVFLSNKGTLLFSSVMTKPVRAALAEAGVTRPFRAAHGFRHTFNDLLRRVADGEVVRALTGHATEDMSSHYSHVRLPEKHAAVAKLVEMISAENPTADQ